MRTAIVLLALSLVTGCVQVTVSVGAQAPTIEPAKAERVPSAPLYDDAGHPLYTDPGW